MQHGKNGNTFPNTLLHKQDYQSAPDKGQIHFLLRHTGQEADKNNSENQNTVNK